MVVKASKPDRGFRLIIRLIYSTLKKCNSLRTVVILTWIFLRRWIVLKKGAVSLLECRYL